jgi:hypothetical protein
MSVPGNHEPVFGVILRTAPKQGLSLMTRPTLPHANSEPRTSQNGS